MCAFEINKALKTTTKSFYDIFLLSLCSVDVFADHLINKKSHTQHKNQQTQEVSAFFIITKSLVVCISVSVFYLPKAKKNVYVGNKKLASAQRKLKKLKIKNYSCLLCVQHQHKSNSWAFF